MWGAATGVPGQRRPGKALGRWGWLPVLALLALEVVGCNGWIRPVDWSSLGPQRKQQSPFKVISKKGSQVAALNPDDIVRIMQRVGFADEQILELGTELHNALRFSGMAAILYHKETLAVFVAEGDYIRIKSRSGVFNYQISQGQFETPPRGNW